MDCRRGNISSGGSREKAAGLRDFVGAEHTEQTEQDLLEAEFIRAFLQ